MTEYEKTKADTIREQNDLTNSPIMRFIKNQDLFKFRVGDVLVKQVAYYPNGYDKGAEWKTSMHVIGAPKKYQYLFENELGIGYIRQLKADGSALNSTLMCMANFDPNNTRFIIDPDYVDHLLLSDGEEKFEAANEWLAKRAFRTDAIRKNTERLVGANNLNKLYQWLNDRKVGDVFWRGSSWDEMVESKYEITGIDDKQVPAGYATPERSKLEAMGVAAKFITVYREITIKILQSKWRAIGATNVEDLSDFRWKKLTDTLPDPLSDDLCGHQK
jgi:hypothetical protein